MKNKQKMNNRKTKMNLKRSHLSRIVPDFSHTIVPLSATTWRLAYEPIPGTVSLIDRLGVAGYELLYLSDNVEDRIEYLEETYGFLHRFKDGVFSHRVGIRKPNPRIYELVLEKAAHPPAQCLFVDDKPAMLEPAERMGMAVVAFESPSQVETALVGHGRQF